MKATSAKEVRKLADIPNIGPAMVRDFKMLGIDTPLKLKKQTAYALYTKLNNQTGARHDPCVLDVFMTSIDFMNGAPTHPWWRYTKERKKLYPNI